MWDIEIDEEFWEQNQLFRDLYDDYWNEIIIAITAFQRRLGEKEEFPHKERPYGGQAAFSWKLLNQKAHAMNDLDMIMQQGLTEPGTGRHTDIVDLFNVLKIFWLHPEWPDYLEEYRRGGPHCVVAEWILDNERGWVVAHQLRARIPDKEFGDHLAWFNWAFGLYQRWAPRRFTFWRRFLDLPDFDETLEPAVQVFDTDIDTVLATVPNFDTTSECYAELLHRAKRARRLGKLDWAGERRKPQQRRAFDLVAALYSNVLLRKFKGATWWQDAGTLDRWMFKHKLILQLSETHQRDANPFVEPGMGLWVWVPNLNQIVAEYKIWAQPIVDAIGEGRRVPISRPEAVLQRPSGSSPLIDLEYYTGPESVHRMSRHSRERFDLAKTSKYLIRRHRDLVENHEPWSLDRERR